MYKFKQDLASAYFPDNSKETASKRFAHEIHSWYACEHRLNQLTAVSNKPLLAALQATGNPERELSTAELNQMKRRTPAPEKSSPLNKSKSSSPSSASHNPTHHHQQHSQNNKGETSGLALNYYLYHHHQE